MVLAGVIGTTPTAVSGVSFDSIQVLSSVPRGGDAEAKEVWSMLGARQWAETEVVLIHTERGRKNRNSPDPHGGQGGGKQKWF